MPIVGYYHDGALPNQETNNDDNTDLDINENANTNTENTTALRLEFAPTARARMPDQQQNLPRPRSAASLNNNHDGNIRNTNSNNTNGPKSSHMYVLFSAFVALLAIIAPPTRRHSAKIYEKGQTTMSTTSSSPPSLTTTPPSSSSEALKALNYSFRNNIHYNAPQPPPNTESIATNLNHIFSKHASSTSRQFTTVEQVARAAATARLSDLSSGKDHKPRILKYAADVVVDTTSSLLPPISRISHEDEMEVETPSSSKTALFKKLNQLATNVDHTIDWETTHSVKEQQGAEDIKNGMESSNNDNTFSDDTHSDKRVRPLLIRWFMPKKGVKTKDDSLAANKKEEHLSSSQKNTLLLRIAQRLVEPGSFSDWMPDSVHLDPTDNNESSSSSSSTNNNTNSNGYTTQIFDKIIYSTPRLLAIANLLLAGTYLLHSAVADFFLGEASQQATRNNAGEFGDGGPTMVGIGGVGVSASNRIHRSGRERLGGYLLFKLLLISAVVEPDTLDLLILLSWYTLLSFLKSLSYLAGVTTAHAAASGQMPHKGVLRLLIIVFVCDLTAAATCTALFHAAGWGMVILLTCDCALLVLDILTHLMRYFQQVLDERHQSVIAELEARQIQMYEMSRGNNNNTELNERDNAVSDGSDGGGSEENPFLGEDHLLDPSENDAYDAGHMEEDVLYEDDSSNEIHVISRQLDHEMELLEATNIKRLAILDNIAFFLEIWALVFTTGHFIHIWSLHGVTFNLVDGVLALHLHSAVSAIGKKVSERRNHNRIARDLDNYFEDVTDLELKKACAAGDVCCICLGTMSMGNVKKIGCGHIYHTNCLREVVERARSIEGARCPLCRQSIVDGSHIPTPQSSGMPQPFMFGGFAANNQDRANPIVPPRENPGTRMNVQQDENNNQNRNATGQDGDTALPENVAQNQNERALFRFSTEGILPAWLPLPAFSFEVVRRPPLGTDTGGDNAAVPAQMQPQQNVVNNTNNNNNNIIPQQQEEVPQSFWRRLLILAGAIPMSPEEEAAAINQLVDMFPQYERADLLRELRERGSAEAVVESVLAGVFTGVDRGGAMDVDDIVIDQGNGEEEEEVEEVNIEDEVQSDISNDELDE